jgi:predicted HTH transcriptional regulator
MLSANEIEAALSAGYELRGLELKGAGARTDSHLFAKVTRAALSLGNLRDGGHVVVGIDDDNPSDMLPGLSATELASWLAYDDVARKLAEYSDPPLRFDVKAIKLASGAHVAVIQIFEFADTPHLCAKQYQQHASNQLVLRRGALYVRPRKVPETSEVASLVEMRDVLQLATQKALRAYVETAERAGLSLGLPVQAPPAPTDDERYEAQRQGGWF